MIKTKEEIKLGDEGSAVNGNEEPLSGPELKETVVPEDKPPELTKEDLKNIAGMVAIIPDAFDDWIRSKTNKEVGLSKEQKKNWNGYAADLIGKWFPRLISEAKEEVLLSGYTLLVGVQITTELKAWKSKQPESKQSKRESSKKENPEGS